MATRKITAFAALSLAILASLYAYRPVSADTCAGRPGEYRNASIPDNDAGHVWGDPVPDGERWVIRHGGLGSTAGNQVEYMMEIAHPVVSAGGACCWYIPIARSPGKPDGTPVLALERDITLLAGERLGGRANGLKSGESIVLYYVYWAVPASCVTISTYAPR